MKFACTPEDGLVIAKVEDDDELIVDSVHGHGHRDGHGHRHSAAGVAAAGDAGAGTETELRRSEIELASSRLSVSSSRKAEGTYNNDEDDMKSLTSGTYSSKGTLGG